MTNVTSQYNPFKWVFIYYHSLILKTILFTLENALLKFGGLMIRSADTFGLYMIFNIVLYYQHHNFANYFTLRAINLSIELLLPNLHNSPSEWNLCLIGLLSKDDFLTIYLYSIVFGHVSVSCNVLDPMSLPGNKLCNTHCLIMSRYFQMSSSLTLLFLEA